MIPLETNFVLKRRVSSAHYSKNSTIIVYLNFVKPRVSVETQCILNSMFHRDNNVHVSYKYIIVSRVKCDPTRCSVCEQIKYCMGGTTTILYELLFVLNNQSVLKM